VTVLVLLDPEAEAGTGTELVGIVGQIAERSGRPLEGVAVPASSPADAAAAGLAELVRDLSPAAVIAPTSDHCTDVMVQLAAQTGLPLAVNCVAVDPAPGDQGWGVTRVRGGGVLLEDAELVAPTKLLTHSVDHATMGRHADMSGLVLHQLPQSAATETRVTLVERTAAGTGVTLATAPVVVSGGRGVGSADGFAVLEELAGLLGGAVGCSRVATNNGWRPHSDQVGQTGTKVSPDLYIAAGISGATQHWAGCMGAKAILAVNTDPEAPMMTRAHYAVVGDAQEVLRAVVEELRARRSR
jgi:electron transfer flavoprotein alpha subunit